MIPVPVTLFYETLEPVHVGAGGYRLGRVDNTICREPGTMLPKIPGTSLAGASRAYAALAYGKREASGQHRDLTPAQRVNCPILFTFGTATDQDAGFAGKVSFGDAHIVFFPVATMAGPVWVSTPELLESWCEIPASTNPISNPETLLVSPALVSGNLNLGWILFNTIAEISKTTALPPTLAKIATRLVLVHPSIFPQIVNSNLEVRTSVSISWKTGAADGGALFTYEAIPRGAFLAHQIVEDNFMPLTGIFPVDRKYSCNPGATAVPLDWPRPIHAAVAGLELIDPLGIGGMGTRGFGRMKLLNPPAKGGN